MPKKTRPLERDPRRQAAIDYNIYSRRALLRFDLEGKAEAIRQHRAWLSLCESVGQFAMSERIRRTVEREEAHAVDLATALGEGSANAVECSIRPRSRGLTKFNDA